jgi:ParB family transcriptional regulator, chromosome partitioning protein
MQRVACGSVAGLVATGRRSTLSLEARALPARAPEDRQGAVDGPRLQVIPLDAITPRGDQPRQSMDSEGIEDLARSIRQRGVLQPIRVRPTATGYSIIAGGRRWEAARKAGLREIPAVIANSDDDEAFLDALVENIQREDLNAFDRAQALRSLRALLGAQSWEQVGAAVGIRRRQIHNLLNVTKLPDAVVADIRSGQLTEKHGRALLLLRASPELQGELRERIRRGGLCADAAMDEARRMRGGASPEETTSPRFAPLSRALANILRHLDQSADGDIEVARPRLEELASRIAERLAETAAAG